MCVRKSKTLSFINIDNCFIIQTSEAFHKSFRQFYFDVNRECLPRKIYIQKNYDFESINHAVPAESLMLKEKALLQM